MVSHHPHDRKWIEQQINQLPERLWKKAAKEYDRVFRETYDATLAIHKKEGEARREANTRLRLYVAAVLKKIPA